MSLSLCMVTKDSAAYVERLLSSARSFADEIVVAVDSSSTDDTDVVCGRYADKLFDVEPVGYAAPALNWLSLQCEGDWIIRIDDDELFSERLVAALPSLMRDREVTHYWLRRRWMVDETRWISQRPWWTDYQLRMYRNIPSIVHVSPRVHTIADVHGAARYVYDGSLYHMDFVYHGPRERREKAQKRYEDRAPGKGLGHYYTPDQSSLETSSVPEDDPPVGPKLRVGWWDSSGRRVSGTSRVTGARRVSLKEMRISGMHDFDQGPRLFQARIECMDCPPTMAAGQWYPVSLRLRNDSAAVWPLPGQGRAPEVRVGYHWLRTGGEIHEFRGHLTPIPHTLWPDETTRFPASVRAPEEPGNYVIQWDLAMKDVGWFSRRGWPAPTSEVRVEGSTGGEPGSSP